MINLGQMNTLTVVKQVPFGIYLDGGDEGEILLPKKFVPEGCEYGDELNVFIYCDSDDKLIATTQRPRAMVGQFAFLRVVSVNRVGAFLDWGLSKDLLVPYPQQRRPMEEGKSYIVYVNIDNEGRVVATSKIDKFLDQWPANYEVGETVKLLTAERTEMGTKVIINHRHWGLVHKDEVFKSLVYGKRIDGYIKKVRADGKIDVVLSPIGRDKVAVLADRIVLALRKNDGFLGMHDKSSPDEIKKIFGESKKTFKSALGFLYKQGKIEMESSGIRLKEAD